jgi:AcrR family transcriptional regulator
VTTAADVRRSARYAARTQQRATDATELLYVAIGRAYRSGVHVADIADAAGLSRARIYQILDANRQPSDPPVTLPT